MSKVVSITTFVVAPSEPSRRRLAPVRGLADDLDVLLGLEDHAEARADERLVVDDEDPDPRRAGLGERRGLRDLDLVDRHRPVEVLQALRAEVAERDPAEVVLGLLDERVRRRRDEDLPAARDPADPGRPVDGEAHVAIGGDRRLTGVDAHAHADPSTLGPLGRLERPLALDRREDGVPRIAEDEEDGVALRAELLAAGGFGPA